MNRVEQELSRSLGPESGGQASSETSGSESYDEWCRRFAAERLKVLYYLGLIANPVFIGADVLLYRSHLQELLLIRAVLEAGLLIGFVALRQQLSVLRLQLLLVFWVVFPNICVVHMTMVLGGFTSSYYNGLNLIFLAAAVIVPVSWTSHLAAQAATMTYYYSANFAFGSSSPAALNAAIENSFFLVWTCVALLFSVAMYERLQRAEFQARLSERHAREQLETSHRKLLELDRLKTEFFANISHELRTPLTLSLGAYKTLLKLSPSPECRELIQSGLRNTARLLFLINELLDLAKFESGRAELKKRCIDLAAIVRGIAANFDSGARRRIHSRGMEQPVAIAADPLQMKKVLYNLLSNAFKFSDPEEGQVWMRLRANEDRIELEIEDNGIGIPHNQLERIFDRFTQVEGSATRRYEGTGIGLALVREIVDLHGGRIAVESKLGQGSTFTITLPRGGASLADLVAVEDEEVPLLSLVHETREKRDRAMVPSPASTGRLPLVLVTEDNADMRAYVEGVLNGQYRIALAKDGAEGLEQAKTLRPDLILTDAMMPRMSGYDLLKAVRSDETLRSIPVIFLTARAGTEARIESLDAGADDYLAKPFDENELLARVGNLIRARAQERELTELQKEKLTRFLPQPLGEMIMSGTADRFLKSHRTDVTVLFLDLRGFTAFAETADPEDVMNVLREYQAETGRIVADYQGTLERFSGDAMMIFLNDPVPVQNHVEQGVRMAIAMRNRLEALRIQWGKRGYELGAGVGIATGYATLGLVGFERRTDYAAIGTVTNLAARLCGEAQHGQILVTERVRHFVENLVSVEPVGELTLKGFSRPVAAYNIAGLRNHAPSTRSGSG